MATCAQRKVPVSLSGSKYVASWEHFIGLLLFLARFLMPILGSLLLPSRMPFSAQCVHGTGSAHRVGQGICTSKQDMAPSTRPSMTVKCCRDIRDPSQRASSGELVVFVGIWWKFLFTISEKYTHYSLTKPNPNSVPKFISQQQV